MPQIIIVCDFNLGTKTQLIYKCDEINGTVEPIYEVNFADLPERLIMAYTSENAKLIHLYGVEEILTGVVEQIKSLSSTAYGLTNLNIEIN